MKVVYLGLTQRVCDEAGYFVVQSFMRRLVAERSDGFGTGP